jgi:acyl-lipid omega-6 desaturase (Delta-12 desaturase)
MSFNPIVVVTRVEKPAWYLDTAKYAKPDIRSALWQLLSTLISYALLMSLMVVLVRRGYPYSAILALSVVAAALHTRIFIFFHDCTHGSFLPSPRLNRNVGYLCGILVFTAFHDWRRSHAGHHITAGDLDRRGIGDITLMTVEEYLTAPLLKRIGYRLYRNPLIMFGIGPLYYFLLRNRFSVRGAKKIDFISVISTNLAIAAIVTIAWLTIGIKTYIMVQLPVLMIAATFGVWLFYIQHQFDGVYWARHDVWDPWRMALEGASYYKLPKLVQWISGNIGFHHVHHVRPAIPNYRLQQCFDEVPQLQQIRPVTFLESLKSLRLHLLDEEANTMVSFWSLKTRK